MRRFHIVVFNYERISSFLDNFDKITNFDPGRDEIYVLDCSVNQAVQKQALVDFANEKGWQLGGQVHFVARKNWGIDEGARVDYFGLLHNKSIRRPKYIWQFQEHYLDLSSEWSWWPVPTINVDGRDLGGQLKGDTIPDGLSIDLDMCEEIYETHPEVSMIYADRLEIGVFPYTDIPWFYVDGANFSVRTSYALQVFDRNVLENCRSIYDGTYRWALFMEFNNGHQLTMGGAEWYDLVNHLHFNNLQSLRELEQERNLCLHQVAEEFYDSLYKKYERKYLRAANAHLLVKRLLRALLVFQPVIYPRAKSYLKFLLAKWGLLPIVRIVKTHLEGRRQVKVKS